MKIRCFFTAVLAAASLTAAAQDGADPMYMVVQLNDGSYKAIDTDAVGRITFDGSSMKAADNGGNTLIKIDLSTISAIEFSDAQQSSIESAITDQCAIAYDAASASLRISASVSGPLSVYDPKGAIVLTVDLAPGEATIDLSALSSGVYIVNHASSTLKFSKK